MSPFQRHRVRAPIEPDRPLGEGEYSEAAPVARGFGAPGSPTTETPDAEKPGTPLPAAPPVKRVKRVKRVPRFSFPRIKPAAVTSLALATGAFLGGGYGHYSDLQANRSFRNTVEHRATDLRLSIAETERWLLSSLVADPIGFADTAAAAEQGLRKAKLQLARLRHYGRLSITLPASEALQKSFDVFQNDATRLLTSLRAGDFPGALRLGAAIGGEPTTSGPSTIMGQQIASLYEVVVASEVPGNRNALEGAFAGLGTVTVASLLLRQRKRRLSRHHLAGLARQLSLIEPSVIVLDRLGRIEMITEKALSLMRVPNAARETPLVTVAGDQWAELAASDGTDSPIIITMTHAGVVTEIEAANPVFADDRQALLWILRDVTAERSQRGELTRKAFHDPLTGLPNREHFRQVLLETLAMTNASDVSVLFVDLDGFKPINDSYGHATGDRLLSDVAHRLREIVRGQDIVGRLGGDEFALVLKSTRPRYAEVVAEQIVVELAQPFVVDGRSMRIGASVGYTHAGPRSTVEDLLLEADVAMYRAKSEGKGRAARFDPAMLVATRQLVELERELRVLAESGQLKLLYQPVVDLSSGRMVGMEALVRWHHPERGLVPPTEFITAAEANGSIIEIGRWVLRNALVEFQRIPASYALQLNINVSPRQLCEPSFVSLVLEELTRASVPPELVTLEITESLSLGNVEEGIARLHELKALGVRLAMDDFGTGYSSLSYLARLPIDTVKIDQTFVQALQQEDLTQIADGGPTGSPRTSFIAALIDLCKGRGLTVVAEGVEEPFQAAILRKLGCDFAQGFLFARPLSLATLEMAVSGSESEIYDDELVSEDTTELRSLAESEGTDEVTSKVPLQDSGQAADTHSVYS